MIHDHTHGHAFAAPGGSLLRLSLGQRLGVAAVPVVLLWALTWWALA